MSLVDDLRDLINRNRSSSTLDAFIDGFKIGVEAASQGQENTDTSKKIPDLLRDYKNKKIDVSDLLDKINRQLSDLGLPTLSKEYVDKDPDLSDYIDKTFTREGFNALKDYYDEVRKNMIEDPDLERSRLEAKLKKPSVVEQYQNPIDVMHEYNRANHPPKFNKFEKSPSHDVGKTGGYGGGKNYSDARDGGVAPIVLDLNGDGKVDLVSYEQSPSDIDVLGTGYKHHAGWVGPGDGLLAIDLDGDGKINKSLEWAFANQTTNVEGDTDLEALASLYDSNKDGVLDAKDADWLKFRIWQAAPMPRAA